MKFDDINTEEDMNTFLAAVSKIPRPDFMPVPSDRMREIMEIMEQAKRDVERATGISDFNL